MQRKGLVLAFAFTIAVLSGLSATTLADGPILEHEPPAQVYQGVAFRLQAVPKAPIAQLLLHADLAGTQLTLPMRLVRRVYIALIPAKATRERRGHIAYHFEAIDREGRSTRIHDPEGGQYRVRLVPQPAAVLLYPVGNKVTTETFAVTIGLNEAFAILPVDSFKVSFASKDVSRELTYGDNQISFAAGPGLRNGTYAVKLETSALPGWKTFKRSWTFSLRKEPPVPGDQEGPLTASGAFAGNSADLGPLDFGQPIWPNVSWRGRLLEIDGGFIAPELTPLTVTDPTPLEPADLSLLGVQGSLDLGPLSGKVILGQSAAGDPTKDYPQLTVAGSFSYNSLSLNLAAVADDQGYLFEHTEPAQQSYVASLAYTRGGSEPGQRGYTVEYASALSFPQAVGFIDWTALALFAQQPGAPDSVKRLYDLRFIMQGFPVPAVSDTDSSTWPQLGDAFRLAIWAPIKSASGRLEISRLSEQFLSLGSPTPTGTTAVLMVAMDPERAATKPFTYDPGPVGDNPRGALGTYGLHFTGLAFTLFGDPARAGLDYFSTEWNPLAYGYDRVRTFRLLGGYYTYLDLDLVLEMSVNENSTGTYRHYGLEATATRKIGRLTLCIGGGLHQAKDLSPDPNYGVGVDLKYAGNIGSIGLVVFGKVEYGDPDEFDPDPMELRWMIGGSLNF